VLGGGGVHGGVVDLAGSGHYFGHISTCRCHTLGAGDRGGEMGREGVEAGMAGVVRVFG